MGNWEKEHVHGQDYVAKTTNIYYTDFYHAKDSGGVP